MSIAIADDKEPNFSIWEFQITGSTQLDAQKIERVVYAHLGPDKTISDVRQAGNDIEKLYRDAGLGAVVVNIPEQNVDAGIVKLEIFEGRVERVLVTGSRYFSPERIRKAAPSMAVGQVLNLPKVQQEIFDLNKISRDRHITPVLRPGQTKGSMEVDLRVDDSLPVHGSIEVNNRYSRDTKPTRIDATLSYDNLWQREHSISFGYQVSPQNRDDVEVFFGTYLMRFPYSAWIASAHYIKSKSDIASVGTLGVLGKGDIAGLLLVRPLGRFFSGFHTATMTIDYKNFEENVALVGNDTGIETPIDYWTVGASYDLTFPGNTQSADFGVDLIVAPRFLGNDQRQFDQKRFRSQANFAYLNFNLSYQRALWGSSLLRVRTRARLADSPLISNEQLSLGGAGSVRGYLEAQQFVDNGYSGQLEFFSPDFGTLAWDRMSARLFLFSDAGGGGIKDPLPEQKDSFFLWSAGAGLRLAFWDSLKIDLDWAIPFRDSDDGGIELDENGNIVGITPPSIESGDDRLHFTVKYGF